MSTAGLSTRNFFWLERPGAEGLEVGDDCVPLGMGEDRQEVAGLCILERAVDGREFVPDFADAGGLHAVVEEAAAEQRWYLAEAAAP